MKNPQIVAILLWVLSLADGVRQGFTLSLKSKPPGFVFDAWGFLVLALPVTFFGTAPLWMKGHPFDARLVREWVNKKWGKETYESYTRAIQPLLLFAAVGFAIGFTSILNAARVGAAESTFLVGGFFVSVGIGAVICRNLLRKRGCTIE